jgi:frataxin-like iron-binding protein CyaY
VVSPNAPVKQIWVSAHMKSRKLDWDAARSAFVSDEETLIELIAEAVGKQLGTPVRL